MSDDEISKRIYNLMTYVNVPLYETTPFRDLLSWSNRLEEHVQKKNLVDMVTRGARRR